MENKIAAVNASMTKALTLFEKWERVGGGGSYTFKIMYLICQNEMTTQKEISERFLLPKQTVNVAVKRLIDEDIITMKRSMIDGRSRVLVFTPKGRELAIKLIVPLAKCQDLVMSKLRDSDLDYLLREFTKYADCVSEVIDSYQDVTEE